MFLGYQEEYSVVHSQWTTRNSRPLATTNGTSIRHLVSKKFPKSTHRINPLAILGSDVRKRPYWPPFWQVCLDLADDVCLAEGIVECPKRQICRSKRIIIRSLLHLHAHLCRNVSVVTRFLHLFQIMHKIKGTFSRN